MSIRPEEVMSGGHRQARREQEAERRLHALRLSFSRRRVRVWEVRAGGEAGEVSSRCGVGRW